jgi:hypothetical protein
LPRIARWGHSNSDTSVVKWRRALVAQASAGENDVATTSPLIQTSGEFSVVSLLCTEAQVRYRGHNACEASCAKMAVTGLARR